MRILYGSPISPFVRKVAVLLEEKGLYYEWKPVRPHDRDEAFGRISPLGKIPAYQDDAVGLADSSVICMYLEKTSPAVPLYPGDAIELARALWFEEYFDSALITPMLAAFTQLWLNPVLLDKPVDQAALAQALEVSLPPMLAYLESEVRPGQWMAGGQFSIADISLGLGFANFRLTDFVLDKGRYPGLASYIDRIQGRPSFQKCDAFLRAYVDELLQKKRR